MKITAKEIYDKALELGYAACGIIKAEDMRGYGDKINARIGHFPETKSYYSYFRRHAKPEEAEPFVKSIIVCAGRYGKYNIPEELQGRIAKFYLTDYRVVPESKEYQAAAEFDEYLSENGVKAKRDINGISAGRYAAAKAGIGIIRKNNFLYTEYGSWVWLDTWFIDQELEYIGKPNLPPCPTNCTKCIDACTTRALSEPYQMNAFKCISMLTWGGTPNTLPPEELRGKMNGWVYGCDDCQDCCPINKGCWTADEDFPRIGELKKYLTLEQLCTLDYKIIEAKLKPLFYYIKSEYLWKWRVNALRAMTYEYRPEYLPYIEQARGDENALVREMADWAYKQIQNKDVLV